MRSKKAFINYTMSLLLQVFTIIIGFILPAIFIKNYGSAAFGLTTSIAQFLGYLTLLQSGVGGVIRAALYRPLAENDNNQLSRIINSTEAFFKKLAYITIIYVAILIIVFPIINNEFDFVYMSTMILIISIGSFFQYYFGITNQMLLESDQKSYVYSLLQLICTIVNAVVLCLIISGGFSIHAAKFISALIFAARPILINIYVKQKYKINRNMKRDDSVIANRWDGFGQTIAYFIHRKTDYFLITLFMNLSFVSIYSLYVLVNTGLTTFISALTNAVQSAFGNMLVKNENESIKIKFDSLVTLIHLMSTIMFTTAMVMIIPFIKLYTNSFPDKGNYIQPLFAFIIILAECIYCYRLPYHTIINAAGHYKETRRGAFIEAIINIMVSSILINIFGIIGVAIGTLIAMSYRTINYTLYLRRNIINSSWLKFIKHMCLNIFIIIITVPMIIYMQNYEMDGFIEWIGITLLNIFLIGIFSLIFNALFFKNEMKYILLVIKNIFRK